VNTTEQQPTKNGNSNTSEVSSNGRVPSKYVPMKPPLPPQEFRDKVRKEIAIANAGARELIPPPPPPPKKKEKLLAEPRTMSKKFINRRCNGCGCKMDEQTEGCRICYWRHTSRRRAYTNRPRYCKECGTPTIDENGMRSYNEDCGTCRQRRSNNNWRYRKGLIASPISS
jgi:hypothetical protein